MPLNSSTRFYAWNFQCDLNEYIQHLLSILVTQLTTFAIFGILLDTKNIIYCLRYFIWLGIA